MPIFGYKASKPNGDIVTGKMDAQNYEQVYQKLSEQQLLTLDIQQDVDFDVKKFTDKPVGASYAAGVYVNQSWLTKVDADFIVPTQGARSGGVRKIAGFKGPQLLDTDHGWALTSNVAGLRTAWDQGRSIWLMDGFNGDVLRNRDNLQPDRDFITSVLS